MAPGVGGEVFNCACNERVTLNQLIGMLNEFLGTEIEPMYADRRTGDVRHSLADISKAERMLGYHVVVPLRAGLQRLVDAAG